MAIIQFIHQLHPEVLLDRFKRAVGEISRVKELRRLGKDTGDIFDMGAMEEERSELEEEILKRMGSR